ncbi:hypothetical protein Kfla_1670 [Kribbella flavida DSM 17836]|uniref:Uncharacterized protein n=1 Tax=Kribbella flavida (strain DSM 17836 / JCM 10339 / NBRC 14399) TaxID=479435 RepID=D2PMM1_KRIFD|nr:hypothetical protein [Kribbella flavida]ADB30765.1 hypothetical protein Kfla_1670 [Kribbella flavida DSM 17836]
MDRRELLLEVRRTRNDCVFGLRLTLDAQRGERGIAFAESYDYLPLPGDPGREYIYSVYAPYDALGPLTAYFEQLLGQTFDGTPADRFVACFHALVAAGELGDNLALQENHRRVATWCEAAGIPAESETFSWINSD